MKLDLERIELREIKLPLKHPFETSFGRTTERRIMIVRAFDKSGAFGYGECTAPEDPFFNHETIDTAWIIVTEYAAPLLGQARIPDRVVTALRPDRPGVDRRHDWGDFTARLFGAVRVPRVAWPVSR